MSNDVQPEWMKGFEPKSAGPGGRWIKGMPSPNRFGRPKGPDKRTKLMQRMLEDADDVVDAVLAKAKEGDAASATLVLSRILPALRSQCERVAFEFDASHSISRQVEQVLQAISEGVVAPDTGKLILEAIQTLSAVRAVEDLEARLLTLEEKA